MTAVEHFVDGVRIVSHVSGAGTPVVLLHGFGGSHRDLAPLAEILAADHRTISIDLVGHGESDAPRDPLAYTMKRCVSQVARVIAAHDAAPAHVFGYSMGGRAALCLAIERPELVRSLALLGASAGLDDVSARKMRIASDEALARRIEHEGVAAWATAWGKLPLFASQAHHLSEGEREVLHARRLANRAHGLACSLRGMGTGSQPPQHDRLGRVCVPVWVGHGADDAKFADIASDLAARLPQALPCAIPRAGHAAHLENRSAVATALQRFFADVERQPTSPLPTDSLRTATGETA